MFLTPSPVFRFVFLVLALIVIAEMEDDLIKRLNEWKDNVENRGMRVMNKTKVMISGERQKQEQKAVMAMWLSLIHI